MREREWFDLSNAYRVSDAERDLHIKDLLNKTPSEAPTCPISYTWTGDMLVVRVYYDDGSSAVFDCTVRRVLNLPSDGTP